MNVAYSTEGCNTNGKRPKQQLLKVDEVAEVLQTGKDYVYESIRTGRLVAVYLGNGTRQYMRVRPDDLDDFIASRRVS